MLKSHSIVFSDFQSEWYKHWAKKLQQTSSGKGKFALRANKFWQNAVMAQALFEHGMLQDGKKCLGFGVGKERLPALFASMGVKVTATDQDFTKAKAKQWNNGQLAQGAFSLNENGICTPDLFAKNVEFMPLDMNNIPTRLHGKYDFLWSNCALGHLGSIEKGLGFIESSLRCLKPGGWAVHTTEVNIISNDETVTTGDTVIFRLKDIYTLCRELTKQGFVCSPFSLSSSTSRQDDRVSLNPVWGTDHTKILVGGHIATQIVLIINKPAKRLSSTMKTYQLAKHKAAYLRNWRVLKGMNLRNPTLKLLGAARKKELSDYRIKPLKKSVKLDSAFEGDIVIEYLNESPFAITGIYSLFDAKPLVLGTDNPINHDSVLFNKTWFSPNRPAVVLASKRSRKWENVDYVKPGDRFGFIVSIQPKTRRKVQSENFSIIQERGGVVPGTNVRLQFIP